MVNRTKAEQKAYRRKVALRRIRNHQDQDPAEAEAEAVRAAAAAEEEAKQREEAERLFNETRADHSKPWVRGDADKEAEAKFKKVITQNTREITDGNKNMRCLYQNVADFSHVFFIPLFSLYS